MFSLQFPLRRDFYASLANLPKEDFDDKETFRLILERENEEANLRPSRGGKQQYILTRDKFKLGRNGLMLLLRDGNWISLKVLASRSSGENAKLNTMKAAQRKQEKGVHQTYIVISIENDMIAG